MLYFDQPLARQHMPFSFLQLPREIRDHIYFYSFTVSVDPPDTPPPKPLPGSLSRDQKELVKSSIYYPFFPHPENCTGLLLANRQIHSECKESLLKLVKWRQLVYKLDCMMVELWEVYPSWLSVPAKLSEISKLEVTYRVSNEVVPRDLNWREHQYINSCISYSFQALLRDILLQGPNFMRSYGGEIETSTSDVVEVGEVVLNVMTHFSVPEDGSYPIQDYDGDKEAFKSLITHIVRVRLNRWIRMGVPYYKCVFGKIKVIRFCVNGEKEKEWDIVAMSRGEYDHDPS